MFKCEAVLLFLIYIGSKKKSTNNDNVYQHILNAYKVPGTALYIYHV